MIKTRTIHTADARATSMTVGALLAALESLRNQGVPDRAQVEFDDIQTLQGDRFITATWEGDRS